MRLHRCLCGFTPETPWQMKKHRRTCLEWKNRPDPRGLAVWRMTHRGRPPPCKVCGTHPHEIGCLVDPTRQLWEAHGLPLAAMTPFLRALARRYPHGVSRHGGPALGPGDALFPPEKPHE